MPAWATVAITLGGAALGALAGSVGAYLGFRGGQLSLAHAEREAWRTRLVEAADSFSQASTAMVTAVSRAMMDAMQGIPFDEAFAEIRAGTAEVTQRQMHVALVFGPASKPSQAAMEMARELVDAREELYQARGLDEQELKAAIGRVLEHGEKADQTHASFLEAAHSAIEPTSVHSRG